MEWHKYPDKKPPMQEDYYAFTHSIPVLTFDGKRIDFGYLCEYEDNEYDSKWQQNNRDGWEIEGVTHWAFLPEPPTKGE